MTLPFDGGISVFFNDLAPDNVRNAIKRSDKSNIDTAICGGPGIWNV